MAEKTSKAKIEDFGQKIGGARKDQWKERGMSIEDLSEMNEAERTTFVKKDNIWPKPDYQAMYESGVPRAVCWYIKSVRDKVPTKPASADSEDQCIYISFVAAVRDALMSIRTPEAAKKCSTFFQDNGYCTKQGTYIYAPYKPTEAGKYLDNKLFKAIQGSLNMPALERESDKKEFLFSEEEKILHHYLFLQFHPEMLSTDGKNCLVLKRGYSTTYFYPEKSVTLDTLKDGEWLVTSRNRILMTGLSNEEECRQLVIGLAKQEQEVSKKQDKGRKTALKPPQLAHIDRIGGKDYRMGNDVSGDAYLTDFGFRGGEFGNWTNQNDRRVSLNMGYDAFKDLAEALNISDKDVSMDGNLAIAFGSRGKGSALAHYEPLRKVINLTKMRGAGALGHEWIHAMDDYAGKCFGVKNSSSGQMLSESGNRKQMPESFIRLMDVIKYRTVSAKEHQRMMQDELETKLDLFRQKLMLITPKGDTPDIEAERIKKIKAVVEEAKSSYDYRFMSFAGSGTRLKLVKDKKPSPAYRELIDFQKANGYGKLDGPSFIEYANERRYTIGSLADKLVNHTSEIEPLRKCSQFYEDAKVIDELHSKSSHGYWSSDCELLARAGAAYIKDKCEALGIRNDYLSGHADMAPVEKDGKWHYPSPQGNERKLINEAFDAFIEDICMKGIFHRKNADSLNKNCG